MMKKNDNVITTVLCLLLFIFTIGAITIIICSEKEITESETIIAECEIIDKNIRTQPISNGKVTTVLKSYYLIVNIDGITEDVAITQEQYNEIETPCNAMFTLYYNSDNELLKAILY